MQTLLRSLGKRGRKGIEQYKAGLRFGGSGRAIFQAGRNMSTLTSVRNEPRRKGNR